MGKAFGGLALGITMIFFMVWLISPEFAENRYGGAGGRLAEGIGNWVSLNNDRAAAIFGFVMLCVIMISVWRNFMGGGGKHG